MQVTEALSVEEYDADDTGAVEAGLLVLEAARAADAPFLPPTTLFRRTMNVRYGWDCSPVRHLLARVEGRAVAVADVELGEWDNRDLAWIDLVVDPAHRRRGYGSQLLSHALDLTRSLGRTKFGAAGWETSATEQFASRHGLARVSQEIYRAQIPQQLPPDLVDEAYAEAAAHAVDYELVRVEGHVADEMLPMMAELTATINDAPIDDLDIEDEVFTAERIRDYERATIEGGHRLYRVLARHRLTGEQAGLTIVAVDVERPELAYQHDTSVVRAHRGHRLGLLLKADMMRWLAEAEPQLTWIETWNAESNQHMIGINDRLGFRALRRELAFQSRL
jgi:GNAT superfamily N-acetyltransferase